MDGALVVVAVEELLRIGDLEGPPPMLITALQLPIRRMFDPLLTLFGLS